MGRMIARSGINPADILVETAAVAEVNTRPVLPRISAPVLLIFGDKDGSFAPEIVAETARLIPHCTLVRYPERGHGGAGWDARTPAHILAFLKAEARPSATGATTADPPAAGQCFAVGNLFGEGRFQLLNRQSSVLNLWFGRSTAEAMRREML